MKNLLRFVILVIFLSSCGSVKNLLQGGRLKQTNFIEKIPFTFNNNLPIVKVNINGKDYNFLFDTGAPTVLSKELAASLGLQAQVSGKTADSGNQTSTEQFVIIPEIKVGKLVYENIGAAVMDLKKVFEYRCINFDGILGANQMAKTYWQIDYQNQLAIATDDFSRFDIPQNSEIIEFIPRKIQLTPLVPLKIGNKTTYATFDTGSSGDFGLKTSSFETEISTLKQAKFTGLSVGGIYGNTQQSTSSFVKVPSLTIGKLVLEDQILKFGTQNSNTIGNLFFKHYSVFINWETNKIYLSPLSKFDARVLIGFGMSVKYVNNSATVGSIFSNSAAANSGILVNDKILSINGVDMTNLTESEACNYAFNNPLKGDSSSVVISRDGKLLTFQLKKVVLLD